MRERSKTSTSLRADAWWPYVRGFLPPLGHEIDRGQEIRTVLSGLGVGGLTAFEYDLRGPLAGVPDISQRIDSPSEALALSRSGLDEGTRGLLRRWGEGRSQGKGPLAEIPSLWLEFDLRARRHPRPLACLRLPPSVGDLATIARDAFGPGSCSRSQAKCLERCRENLPRGARPLYIFDLGARSVGLLRLELFGIPFDGVKAYLQKIGAPVPATLDEVSSCLSTGERPHLSFDLAPGGEILHRIGFETSFQKLPRSEPRWSEMLSRLATLGLCDQQNVDFLLAWGGQKKIVIRPREAGESGALKGHGVRVLSHIKASFRGQERVETKGYLFFHFLRFGEN